MTKLRCLKIKMLRKTELTSSLLNKLKSVSNTKSRWSAKAPSTLSTSSWFTTLAMVILPLQLKGFPYITKPIILWSKKFEISRINTPKTVLSLEYLIVAVTYPRLKTMEKSFLDKYIRVINTTTTDKEIFFWFSVANPQKQRPHKGWLSLCSTTWSISRRITTVSYFFRTLFFSSNTAAQKYCIVVKRLLSWCHSRLLTNKYQSFNSHWLNRNRTLSLLLSRSKNRKMI